MGTCAGSVSLNNAWKFTTDLETDDDVADATGDEDEENEEEQEDDGKQYLQYEEIEDQTTSI